MNTCECSVWRSAGSFRCQQLYVLLACAAGTCEDGRSSLRSLTSSKTLLKVVLIHLRLWFCFTASDKSISVCEHVACSLRPLVVRLRSANQLLQLHVSCADERVESIRTPNSLKDYSRNISTKSSAPLLTCWQKVRWSFIVHETFLERRWVAVKRLPAARRLWFRSPEAPKSQIGLIRLMHSWVLSSCSFFRWVELLSELLKWRCLLLKSIKWCVFTPSQQTSLQLPQVFRRRQRHCSTAKLQKCFVDFETSAERRAESGWTLCLWLNCSFNRSSSCVRQGKEDDLQPQASSEGQS